MFTHHMKHCLATIAALLCCLAVSAHDFEVGGIYYNITSSTDLTVAVTYRGSSNTEYSEEYSGAVTIPATVTYYGNTYRVTSIGDNAFYDCSNLTNITIPEGVTSIGRWAFEYCSSLTSITIPEGVTEIGYYAFYYCTNLTNITIPESVTSIGERAFYNTPWYDTWYNNQPDGVVYINNVLYCYKGTMPENTSIEVKKGTTSIESDAFSGCSNLTSIIIPESVTKIGNYAFYNCSSLTAVHISSIEAWCKMSFDGYNSNPLINAHNLYLNGELVTELVIPEGVTSIESDAFSYCSSLTSITIPKSVTEIGNYAFRNCTSLKKIIIEDGSTTLSLGYEYYDDYRYQEGRGLFYYCPLETVYLGRNLNYSSGGAYGYSPFYNSNRIPTFSFGIGLTRIPDYLFYNNTTLTSTIIPEGVTEIGNSAFFGCSSLTSITLPEGVTSIGYQAFYGCNSLTTIMLPESVTSIGDMAFSNCSSLTTINIPESVTEIGASAFYDTPWYNTWYNNQPDGVVYIGNVLYEYKGTMPWNTSIEVREGTVSISPHAFDYCSNLTAITIPEGVTSIGAYAFSKCRLLTSITIPESVTEIGNYAFRECSSLTSIVVAEGNTVYDSRDNCNAIIEKENNSLIVGCSTTTIPDGVTSIGDYAFYGCRLTSIILPEGVKEIGNYAFDNCYLTSITIPKSVTTFGNYAFSDCTGELVVNCNIPYVSSNEYHKSAFYGSEFTKVTIGKDVTEIGSGAFYDCSSITSILCKSSTPPDCGYNAFSGVDTSIPVYVPYVYPYQSADGWKTFTNLRSLNLGTCGDNLTWYLTNEGELVISGTGPMRNYESNYDIPWYDNKASISKLVIEDGVTALGKRAFRDCSNLTSIICKAKTPPTCYTNTFTGVDKSIPLHVPEASIAAYQSAEIWKNFTMVKPLIVASGACGENLTWYLTDGGELVISGTGAMTDFTSYSNEAPWNEFSEAIVKITIGEGVTSIGDYAFYGGFSRLTTVTLPESLTKIGYSAFYMTNYDVLLTAVHISSIEAWYKISFLGGPNSNPLNYAHNLYLNGELVTELAVPENITSIGNFAFAGCYSLTSVTLPENVTSIGSAAFIGCISLTSINIPEGVTSIGGGTFFSCGSLTSISIPKSVASIDNHAFAYCNGLSDIYYYAEELPTIHSDAFYDVDIDNITLHVPASAVEKFEAAAPWYDFGDIVPIESLATDIILSETSATLIESETLQLSVTIKPEGSSNQAVIWSTTNKNVATVDNTGKVTAIAPGTAIIIATAIDGSGVSASCVVTVEAMPTEVEITIGQYGSGTYCSKYALDFSNVQGLKAYAAAGYNDVTGVVTLLRVMTTQPGTGLFVKGEPGTYEVPVIESSSDHTINMLVGTLVKTPVNKTSDDGKYRNFRYTTKTGVPTPMFYEIADGYTLSANRAYLQIPTAWLPAETKSIALRFDEGEGTTDMDPSTLNPQLSTEVYDLQGRRVTQPVKGSMYIVNGRKVVY